MRRLLDTVRPTLIDEVQQPATSDDVEEIAEPFREWRRAVVTVHKAQDQLAKKLDHIAEVMGDDSTVYPWMFEVPTWRGEADKFRPRTLAVFEAVVRTRVLLNVPDDQPFALGYMPLEVAEFDPKVRHQISRYFGPFAHDLRLPTVEELQYDFPSIVQQSPVETTIGDL